MASTTIRFTHTDPAASVGAFAKLQRYNVGHFSREMCQAIAQYFEALAAGIEIGGFEVQLAGATAVRATATATAGSTDGNITVNGVAIAYTGGTAALRAADIAAKINASVDPLVAGIVTGSYPGSGAVATITAVAAGKVGNSVTLAITGTGASVSAARLGSGAGDDVAAVSFTR